MAPAVRLLFRLFLTAMVIAAVSLMWAKAPHAQETTPTKDRVTQEYGERPAVPDGPLSAELRSAIQIALIDIVSNSGWGQDQTAAIRDITDSKDPRVAWVVSDLMRFTTSPQFTAILSFTASELLGKDFHTPNSWGDVTDHLIAWDIPAPPGYLEMKRAIFTGVIAGWDRIFVEGNIDWRLVSWGGVLIDDRPYNETDAHCNCIPAADNPEVTSAEEATWLKDEDIVFGVTVNGESRAYPRRIMEVREMVNDTLGGRDLGIPYCTLCGAAQAYFTDRLPEGVERPILRTSGLLIRSNKVMYDLNTYSVFDTFLGNAVTGRLAEKNLQLEQATVVTTDWGRWKRDHPETTVLKERYALGRDPDFRNTRDANGPIFPIGDVDPRLPVHEDIVGAITASGRAIAFQRSKAFLALRRGDEIAYENIRLELDAGGIRAVDADGTDVGSHQAFWFAWSQFHPGTALWPE